MKKYIRKYSRSINLWYNKKERDFVNMKQGVNAKGIKQDFIKEIKFCIKCDLWKKKFVS